MQAGACRVHPAREDPLHLALQRDLVDLDKGVGVGGFRRRPRVAGTGLHAQRAELHGLADILVEIDDAAGDLVEAGEARLLVGDLGCRRLGHDLVARLQGRRRIGHALGLALARRQPRQRSTGRWRVGDAWLARLRRLSGNARLRALGSDGRSRRRRQRLRLEASRRRSALPRRRTVRGRQQAAARQFRHFLVVVGDLLLLLIAAGNGARRPQRRIGKDIADLRLRRRHKRGRSGGDKGRKTGQGNGSKHLAAFTGESGSRHSTDLSAARVPSG